MHWLLHILGADNANGPFYLFGSGSGGILIQDVLFAVIGYLLGRLATRLHTARLAQASRHHAELKAQADTHHAELTKQAERHHRQRLDQAADHHEALMKATRGE